ncbi:MAG: MBL fold metallo-hydrolase [Bacteroidota bacterium]
MYIEQIYTKCLAEASYYIESNGEAAVIDPLRETQPYLDLAEERGAKIKYVFETHFHADFVSGHIDLARTSNAKIVFGPLANTSYQIYNAKDGEQFDLGSIQIVAMHTPGHTKESTVWLLKDENGRDHCIFTGDTLFIGDVGRPDLSQKDGTMTSEDMAAMLYDSLRTKIMPLADEVMVYPAHGAGSACGKSMSKETFATLGHQKIHNYALQDISKEQFVKELTTGILPAPQYFAKNATLNKSGYDPIEEVLQRGTKGLSPEEVRNFIKEGALLLDVRKPDDFALGHAKGSLFIGLDGSFAVWVGTLIENLNQGIIVLAPEGREKEATKRLARVGYDNCLGYVDGGLAALVDADFEIGNVSEVSAKELEMQMEASDLSIVDVRKPGEYDSCSITGAQHYALDFIHNQEEVINAETDTFVHCAGGYRSMIAISILKKRGYDKLVNVKGGMSAIKQTTIPLSEMACSM